MATEPDLERLFPNDLMRATMAQAASWTRVSSIITAARVLEGRTNQRTPHFLLAFPDDELLEAILLRVFAYLIPEYRCSREKLALARHVDPLIKARTVERLARGRLNPDIKRGGPSVARKLIPQLAGREPMRVLQIIDTPPMLELIFEPFQMLRTTVVSHYGEAAKLRTLDRAAAETSDTKRSVIVHRPYGDSALVATLDAFVYFALGFRVGIEWGKEHVSVERGFRCFNIVGDPPFQPAHFAVARSAYRDMMEELARP